MADKKFTRKEVELNQGKETMFIIDNLVYDVTAFMDEHPGGHEVLVNAIGKDSTEDFEDVGHSLDAKELMQKFVVGELVEEDKVHRQKRTVKWEEAPDSGGFLSSWQFPLLLGVLLTIAYSYFFA